MQQANGTGEEEGLDEDRRLDQNRERVPLSRGAAGAEGDEGDAYAAAAAAVSTPPNTTAYDEPLSGLPGLSWEDEEEEEGANNAQQGQRSNNHAGARAGSGSMQAMGSWGAGATMPGNQHSRNANSFGDNFVWGQAAGAAGASRTYGSSDIDNDMNAMGMDVSGVGINTARSMGHGANLAGNNMGMSVSPTDMWPPPSPQRRDHARMMKRSKGQHGLGTEGEGEEGGGMYQAGAGSAGHPGSEEEGERGGSAPPSAWTSIPWQDPTGDAGPSQPHQHQQVQGAHQGAVGAGPSHSPALIHSAVHRLHAQMSAGAGASQQQQHGSRGSSGLGGVPGASAGAGEGWGTGDLGGSGSPATGAQTAAGGSTGGGSGAQTWGAAIAQHAGGSTYPAQHVFQQHHGGSFDDVDMPGGRATSMAGSLQGAGAVSGAVSGDEGLPSGAAGGGSWAGGQDGDGEAGGSVHERDLELAEMNETDLDLYQDPSYSMAGASAALPPPPPVAGAYVGGASTAGAGTSAPASISHVTAAPQQQQPAAVTQVANASPKAGTVAMHQCMPGAPPAAVGETGSKLGQVQSDGSDQAPGRGQHHALAPMRALSAQGAYTGSGGSSGAAAAGQPSVTGGSGHTQGGKAAMEE
jgi:hypothetical protein